MKHATLRQMEVFETVARLASYSRAAAELHLTQPAVSTQIRKLEEHAGVPLFEQFGKKIYLTQAGDELLHHSRVILQQFEEAEEAMTHFTGVAGGKTQRVGDQRRRLLFPASARRIRPPPRGGETEPVGTQPRGTAGPSRRQSHRPGRDGSPAGGRGHHSRAFRAAPLRDRRRSRPSAGAGQEHSDVTRDPRAVCRTRTGIGYVAIDG